MFADNARMAHRWSNAANVPPASAEMGRTSSGATHAVDHLREQETIFSHLWDNPDDKPLTETEWADTFQKLRTWALEQRAKGTESTTEVFDLVSIANIRKALARFKKRTSTGLCGTRLQELKLSPDYVIASISKILQSMLEAVLGPSEGMEVLLHLISKKLGGFRTVCTFPSIWRIMMACMGTAFKQWDQKAAAPGDTAIKGRSPESRVFHQSVMASVAVSRGLHHTAVLWDLSSFYESLDRPTIAEAIVSSNMPPTPSVLSLWGHLAARVMNLRGCYTKRKLLPWRSLATGCQSSTPLARAITREPVQQPSQLAKTR